MTDLVSLPDLQAQLRAQAETRVTLNAALTALEQLYTEYEADRLALTNAIDARDSQVAVLEGRVAVLQAKLAMLTEQLAVATADVHVTVGTTPTVSRFRCGMQDVDKAMLQGSAIAKAKIAAVNGVMASHVMNFGPGIPWPNEADGKPTIWGGLDARMQMFMAMHVEPMLVFYNYPVWMKEMVGAGGVVTAPPVGDDYITDGRIKVSKYAQFDIYNYEIAKRYLGAPYNVRVMVFWNEFKGLYNRRDGKPGVAYEEYTTLYNRWVAQVEKAAVDLKIDPATLKLGGPYITTPCEAQPTAQTVPATHPLYGRPYGEYRKDMLAALQYWLANATRKDFVAWDMHAGNRAGGEKVDAFMVAQNKYADFAAWVRTLTNLPIVMTEIYPECADDGNVDLRRICAVKTVAHLSMIEAGYWMVWQWGAIGQGEANQPNGGLLKDYKTGDEQPWYAAYKMLHDHFSEGAALYPVTVKGNGVFARATDTVIAAVNMTPDALTVDVAGKVVTVAGYGVVEVGR